MKSEKVYKLELDVDELRDIIAGLQGLKVSYTNDGDHESAYRVLKIKDNLDLIMRR